MRNILMPYASDQGFLCTQDREILRKYSDFSVKTFVVGSQWTSSNEYLLLLKNMKNVSTFRLKKEPEQNKTYVVGTH